MNAGLTLEFWFKAMGALALQGAVVLVAAGLVEVGVRSARCRRAAWLAALVGPSN